MTETQHTPIYRFKFEQGFMDKLVIFADKHRLDEPDIFKEMWLRWTVNDTNSLLILKEEERLKNLGYKGDIEDKMFKTVRYYLKNKSVKKKPIKKRRKYVGLSKDLKDSMDKHILNLAFKNGLKPADAYLNFNINPTYSIAVNKEIKRLVDLDMEEKEAIIKIKKTYKNRYYLKQKKEDE